MEWFSKRRTGTCVTYSYPLPKPYSGQILVKIPPLIERLKFSKKMFLKGEIIWDEYTKFMEEELDAYILLFNVSVGSRKFFDIHELSCFHDGTKIIQEIFGIVLKGIPADKIKKENIVTLVKKDE